LLSRSRITAVAWVNIDQAVRSRLGANLVRVDRLVSTRHDIIVDPVLGVRRRVRRSEDPLVIRVVIGKKQRRTPVAIEPIVTEHSMRGTNHAGAAPRWHRSQRRLRLVRPP